ncbi:DNA repair protein SNF2 family [Dacryopinax primogenitus]|uniref:DNA repair protein SNF2 family n=1 Tax=Dacryopinax primogenitus (strain DJM 731) TaxID=1858805 RepID=M5G5B5_DACPD|nr:DNA repair protein SNF2 family [Dacryopinax primogenitus]EJU03425.1 DNA repair protein SNF2 family [Dacryopinax primogenitus]
MYKRPAAPTATSLRKPFRTPSSALPSVGASKPARKRKRVSYKESAGSDSDSDDARKRKKPKAVKGKENDPVFDEDGEIIVRNINRLYATFELSGSRVQVLSRSFTIPKLFNSQGELVPTIASRAALGLLTPKTIPPRPLHDPMSDHAIVLYDPTVDDRETDEERRERLAAEEKVRQEKEAEEKSKEDGLLNIHGKSLREVLGLKMPGEEKKKEDKVPVVIDPVLGKVLRPHQVEGVKFLYKCTTGAIVENAYGCIMADEMGLGKTLQCIALMHTLLKQSPRAQKPTIDKAIIACPSSLVKNWGNELVKWLGKDGAPGILSVDNKGTKAELIESVKRWVAAGGRNVTQPVMIVSYETLRTLCAELMNCEIGLLLCDEGHRLKNSDSLTFQALNGLKVQRRVILSGTPIQNDLSEYFSLLNFANPDYLGSRMEFRKNFELAILRGRDADATDKEKENSEAKLKELAERVSKFIIRRTNDLLSKYLPVKYEHVVFCTLSPLQLALYRHFIKSPETQRLLRGQGSQPLKAINLLKKLCNHPELLNLPEDLPGCDSVLPPEYGNSLYGGPKVSRAERGARDRGMGEDVRCEWGGKFLVLERFLDRIKRETNDKIVLISNYTQTLDLFEKMCRSKRYGFFRLDGTMSVVKRQKLVDQFNDPEGKEFVFLLSSKAGGCGINLIGANRLILFDPDWNPAADQQALARVWRDGQKKECFVYRFISTGTIEEKIFQRQAQKQALSSCVVDEKEDAERHFSADDLRKLFLFKDNTHCETHDTFKCKRCKEGKQFIKAPALLYGDASTWNHYQNAELTKLHDDLLRAECGEPQVSTVFQYISH